MMHRIGINGELRYFLNEQRRKWLFVFICILTKVTPNQMQHMMIVYVDCSVQDFGDYADSYYAVQTTEGEQIAQLISGYIDIILKKV